MKFITYQINDKINIGLLDQGGTHIFDINRELGTDYSDMNQLIAEISNSELELLNSKLTSSEVGFRIPLSEVKILSPIPYPKRPFFCLGKNYRAHAKEITDLAGVNRDIPEHPIFFMKIAAPAIGHLDSIPNHQNITQSIDYEVELAVVIGKDGIDIAKQDAADHIFGYTIANDISARNLQSNHLQWVKGKSLEGFAPLGPYLVHRSAFEHPLKLAITASVNDELRQSSNTEQLIFDIPTIISELSKGMYLRKGDIILSGTPSGVGMGFTPPQFLKPGDVIKCEIEGIGVLQNQISLTK